MWNIARAYVRETNDERHPDYCLSTRNHGRHVEEQFSAVAWYKRFRSSRVCRRSDGCPSIRNGPGQANGQYRRRRPSNVYELLRRALRQFVRTLNEYTTVCKVPWNERFSLTRLLRYPAVVITRKYRFDRYFVIVSEFLLFFTGHRRSKRPPSVSTRRAKRSLGRRVRGDDYRQLSR